MINDPRCILRCEIIYIELFGLDKIGENFEKKKKILNRFLNRLILFYFPPINVYII